MNITDYLASPLAAVLLGMSYYLYRREQKIRALLFVGFALGVAGRFHIAFLVAGIVVILLALYKGPEIAKP
jgi:4-amino-4-deoxy-L-arabinose transferase-like glycosyltransferase